MTLPKFISDNLQLAKRHGKIVENTIAMSLITFLNSSFQLIIYPFLIRKVGAEDYGQFAFALSIVSYFMVFVGFGFDMIAAKYMAIAHEEGDSKEKSAIVSKIFSAKFYLLIPALVVYTILILVIPRLYSYKELYLALSLLVVSYVFIPGWYYQALQNNRIYLYIQIVSKVILLFIVLLAVRGERGIYVYTWVFAITSFLGYLVSALYLVAHDKVIVSLVSLRNTLSYFKESSHLFLSNFLSIFKSSGLYIVIGTLFGMKELTAFDFSFRITQNVLNLTKSLNLAIFPNIVTNYSVSRVRRILRKEIILGLVMTLGIIATGWPLIIIMGNGPIIDIAYPVLVIMSGMVFIWFLSSFFIDLVLIPNGKNQTVFWNQLLSLTLIAVFSAASYFLRLPVWAFTLAILIAGGVELTFLCYISKLFASTR